MRGRPAVGSRRGRRPTPSRGGGTWYNACPGTGDYCWEYEGGPNAGPGGGVISISAQTINFTGSISAVGQAAVVNAWNKRSGGSAGGSIRIEGNTITLGTLSAAGGAGWPISGTGYAGLGRIAIYYASSLTNSGTICVQASTYCQNTGLPTPPTPGPTAAPYNPGTVGLVSWWGFNEASGTRIDSHGPNHLTDNNTVAYTSGVLGNSADFESGNSEFLELTDNSSLSSGDVDLTIAAWVKLESKGAEEIIVSKFDAGFSNAEYALWYEAPSDRFCFRIYKASTNTPVGTQCANALGSPAVGVWYYLVGWHDASADTVNIQVNNGVINSSATTGAPEDTSSSFRIGARNTAEVAYFDGLIDEVAVYKRVLSDGERSWLYNGGTGRTYMDVNLPASNPGATNLVGWWSLDEANGNRADSYINGLTLTDNNTVVSTPGKVNDAADFESSNSEFLERADSAQLSTGDIDFTLSAWVKLESKSDVMFIASKRDSATVQEFHLAYDNTSDRFTFALYNSAGILVGFAPANNLGSPSLNTWYFVTGWHDSINNSVGIQVNNATPDTAATTGVPSDTSANFRIGAFFTTEAKFWDGLIDEVSFYKRVLTSAERTWLYNNGSGRMYTDVNPPAINPGTTNLISWWTLNETNATRNDSHTSGNHLADTNTVGAIAGKQGNAANFIAANSEYLSVADNPALSAGDVDFSACGWYYLKDTTADYRLFAQWDAPTNNRSYQILYSPNWGNFGLQVTPDGVSNTATLIWGGASPTANQWYYVCAWHDAVANRIGIQVNNGTTTSAAYSAGVYDSQASIVIGAGFINPAPIYSNIYADEVVFYKRVLTAGERTWLYNNGTGRTYTDLSGSISIWNSNAYTYSPTIPHAVTSVNRVNFTDTFTYDENGNMTCRVESGVTYKQTYDTENRIASITKLTGGTCAAPNLANATQWDFTYDGDGVRTATLITPYNASGQPQTATLTRYYFGGALETSGGVTKKYYSFAGQTVAMKDADFATNGFKYFLGDHLGSVSLVLKADGTIIEQQRYLPFGQPRTMPPYAAVTSTDFTYTGQRALPDTGLMDYKARFYSPVLGRFIQPDTIIPGADNPQSWNRFSYVNNNPIAFNDPTGHKRSCSKDDCEDARDYDGCWYRNPIGGRPIHNIACQNHAFEEDHQITKIKITIWKPIQLGPISIFTMMAGSADDEDDGLESTSGNSGSGGTPPVASGSTGTQLYRVIKKIDPQYKKFLETGKLEPRGGTSTLLQHVNDNMTDSIYTSWTKSRNYANRIYDETKVILTVNTNDLKNVMHNSYKTISDFPIEFEITIEGVIESGISILKGGK
jgi:RHS repeat-associated protein